jgi:GDPmannose 4,6-dehydratase
MNNKTAIVSGARGQDAAWLSKLLLEDGWKVVGIKRRVQSPDYSNIKDIIDHENYILEMGDVTDQGSIARIVSLHKPDHFYHLAANSFVGCSWSEPASVFNINAVGTLNVLEAVRFCSPATRVLLASTSEVVGNSKDFIQDEETILTPHSPYAIAKAAAEHFIKVYRESHKMFCCFSRCYNHESKFRGKEFVTRKITNWIGDAFNKVDSHIDSMYERNKFVSTEDAFNLALANGYIDKLKLGNLSSSRDWLDARDCVRGMKMILDHDKPDDFVLASGKMRSIADLLKTAFGVIGINDYMKFIGQDARYMRPDDVVTLCGDYSKAKAILGWEPRISFEDMVKEMVENDIQLEGSINVRSQG